MATKYEKRIRKLRRLIREESAILDSSAGGAASAMRDSAHLEGLKDALKITQGKDKEDKLTLTSLRSVKLKAKKKPFATTERKSTVGTPPP